MRRTKREINIEDKNRVMKSLAHARWRDAAARYLVEVDGATVHQLLDNVTNKKSNKSSSGRPMKYGPTPNQAINVLSRDSRFKSNSTTTSGKGYLITVWRLNWTNDAVIEMMGDLDEE